MAVNLKAIQRDPAAFRAALLIDCDGEAKRFADVCEQWQSVDFAALDPAWCRVAGQSVEPEYQRAMIERPRGHSKTTDIAVQVTWALFSSRRKLAGIVAAADRDQARLIRDAVDRLVRMNPWLSKMIDVQQWVIRNTHTGSELQILSSDVASSYGLTPDFVVCDELTHWPKADLWESLFSSAAKRPSCLLLIIANAGYQDSWVWNLRESIRKDEKWYFSRLEKPSASWITPEVLAEQARLLPNVAYRRLWENEWVNAGGDALSPEVINAAFRFQRSPLWEPQPGWDFVAAVDLSVSRDGTGLVVLGIRRGYEQHGRITLAYHKLWTPTKGKKIDLQEVENHLVALHARYKFRQINYDSFQAHHLASRLAAGNFAHIDKRSNRKGGLPMVEVPPTGANLQRMASTLIEAMNDFRVECYPCDELKRDLLRLRVEERSYGFRLVSPRDETGHGDLASAFSLALLAATDIAAKPIHKLGIQINNANGFHGGKGPRERAADRIIKKADSDQKFREWLEKNPENYEQIAMEKLFNFGPERLSRMDGYDVSVHSHDV